MEVQFTPEQHARISQMAAKAGTQPERFVTSVVADYLDEHSRYLAAVEKGIEAIARGEFFDDQEMDARVEAMLRR